MTDEMRLQKLKEAEKLIRDVEFSYEQGSDHRKLYYKFIVENFSYLGFIGQQIMDLREKVKGY